MIKTYEDAKSWMQVHDERCDVATMKGMALVQVAYQHLQDADEAFEEAGLEDAVDWNPMFNWVMKTYPRYVLWNHYDKVAGYMDEYIDAPKDGGARDVIMERINFHAECYESEMKAMKARAQEV